MIGWTEHIELPDWGVKRLRAKVDTGARSSALHVENIERTPAGWVHFEVVTRRKVRNRKTHVRARVVRESRVRSSNGASETRLFVKTRMRLGPVEREIEISLVDRGEMIHRMLLGRSALSPFVIDVDRRMVHTPVRKKLKKKKSVQKQH